jgi:hypothetical protein
MRKLVLPLLLATILLAAVLVFLPRARFLENARGQGPIGPDGREILQSETQGDNVREIYGAPGASPGSSAQAPNIGFIDSPTATCYQPDPSVDACYINWYYMSVNASPNYMIAMTATINSIGVVARYSGFFQTSMYVPYNMQDRGIKVSCGELGAGGNPSLGQAYPWTINARDSSNLKSANYGTVFCPAFTP